LGDAPAGAVAAVDCGTNSTRLLVAGPDGAILERTMVITRLGQGVDDARRLTDDAMVRTLDVLTGYRAVIDRHGASRARAVATSAVRDAANGGEFLDRASAVLGVRPELLSGQEEGTLSFRGATAGLDRAEGPFLVVDVGGGSTELVLGGGAAPEPVAVSIDVGCVRVTERFLASDPPTPAELEAGREAVSALLASGARQLDELAARHGAGGMAAARRLIGLAGTVSTAAVLDAGAETYRRDIVHHRVLHRERVQAQLGRLAGMDHASRLGVPGLEPERADVIVGGLLVLVTVMEQFGFGELLASEADILDGIVIGLLET
jgi:exopolyphosphatase/guanosine-5'-triphosphate,3'-diphosphate pyrophosphatase